MGKEAYARSQLVSHKVSNADPESPLNAYECQSLIAKPKRMRGNHTSQKKTWRKQTRSNAPSSQGKPKRRSSLPSLSGRRFARCLSWSLAGAHSLFVGSVFVASFVDKGGRLHRLLLLSFVGSCSCLLLFVVVCCRASLPLFVFISTAVHGWAWIPHSRRQPLSRRQRAVIKCVHCLV